MCTYMCIHIMNICIYIYVKINFCFYIYIGELRGGAWVVIDPTINPQKMEMYADKNSRGGILEPPGICEVKYRFQEQKIAMHRLDNTLIELDDLMNTDQGGIFTRPKVYIYVYTCG
jgi:acetyl-CoA carboxylase/biotin carboxylase 1